MSSCSMVPDKAKRLSWRELAQWQLINIRRRIARQRVTLQLRQTISRLEKLQKYAIQRDVFSPEYHGNLRECIRLLWLLEADYDAESLNHMTEAEQSRYLIGDAILRQSDRAIRDPASSSHAELGVVERWISSQLPAETLEYVYSVTSYPFDTADVIEWPAEFVPDNGKPSEMSRP